jgi:hypothetical protein
MNEYLTQYAELLPQGEALDRWFEQQQKWLDLKMNTWNARRKLTRKYSWAIPTDDAINCIAKYSPIVEIGAGTGYWAHLLQEVGATIHPYDKYPPDGTEIPDDVSKEEWPGEYQGKSWYHRGAYPYTEIRKGSQHVLKEYSPEWNLFLCWPPMDYMAKQALAFHRGRYVIYVGEGKWGCNANNAFFNKLDREYTQIESLSIPQWDGLHDYLEIFERR